MHRKKLTTFIAVIALSFISISIVQAQSAGTITIQYNANGGSGAPSSHTANSASDGVVKYTIQSTIPTRDGYQFRYWLQDNSSDSVGQFPGTTITQGVGNGNRTITYYAQWKAISTTNGTATIRYNANGGVYAPPFQTVNKDSSGVASYNLSTQKPMMNYGDWNNCYEFLGWRLDNSTSYDIDNPWQSITIQLTYGNNEDLTYFAQRRDNGTCNNTPTTTVNNTSTITVSAIASPIRWTTNDKFSYDVFTNVAATKVTYSFDGNNTLYTLHANGLNNFNTGNGSVREDKKRWTWSNDKLSAGNRTITITAYDANGQNATTTLYINVVKSDISTDGKCGSTNNSIVFSTPTTNLCSAGTASSVYGIWPWTWHCVGLNGGNTVNCAANKITPDNTTDTTVTNNSSAMIRPVDSHSYSSLFGYRSEYGKHHKWVDIGVGCWTSVKAMANGIVKVAKYWGSLGNYIVIYHEDIGLSTLYAHLSSMDVTVGKSVDQGLVIWKSGKTGGDYACHLHFEILAKEYKQDSDRAWAINPLINFHETDIKNTVVNPNPVFVKSNGKYVYNTNFNLHFNFQNWTDPSSGKTYNLHEGKKK